MNAEIVFPGYECYFGIHTVDLGFARSTQPTILFHKEDLMLKNTTLMFLLAVLLTFSLSTQAESQNYYPTSIGNTWILESEDKAEHIIYTVEESDAVINNIDLTLLKITSEILGTDVSTSQRLYVDFDEEGIKLYRMVVELDETFGEATAVLYPPGLFYPATLKLGDTWELTAESEVLLVGPITFTSTNEVVAIEDVVTPAGTFENCLKVRLRTRTVSTLGVTRATAYQWLAPNFGPIKFESDQDIVYRLVSSNLLYDLTGDGFVNISDLVFVAARFGQEGTEADVNNDGTVNILDLVLVAKNFSN